jgi:hypothetical protein
LVVFQHRDSAERHGLFGCQENVVQLAVIVAVAVAAVGLLAVVLLVAPEAAAAAETGSSFAPCGIAPIPDSDSKELHLPCRQI